MNQVTNLKSLSFTRKKIANLLSTFFYPYISAIVCFVVDGVAKIVFVSAVLKADHSPAPTL